MKVKTILASLLVALAVLSLAVSACAPAAAPEPTPAPAVPAVPTPAPAVPADPTPAPAVPAAFPVPGKTLTIIVPYAPGGTVDVNARLIAPILERDLGVPVQVVNRPGAASQVGVTEMVRSEPDGHTIALVPLRPAMAAYIDPARQAVYSRQDILPLALHWVDPGAVGVATESPFMTIHDLVDAARAQPQGVTAGSDGLQGEDHLATLLFQEEAGVEFAIVHFDGGAPTMTALLGGHIDVRFGKVGALLPAVTAGQVRALAVMDEEENEHYPGVPTLVSEGYDLVWLSSFGFIGPAGIAPETAEAISEAIRSAAQDPELSQRVGEMGFRLQYMGPEEFGQYWDETETETRRLLELAAEP